MPRAKEEYMSNQKEMEIKLVLDKRSKAKLLKLPLVAKNIVEGSGKTLKLVSSYYDTKDYKLSGAGMAYRLRKTGKNYEATVKTAGESLGGFSARGEYTVQLQKKELVLQGFAPNFDKKLATLLADDELHSLFEVVVERKILLLRITPQTLLELAMDEGELRAEGATQLISEVELEIIEGSKEELFAFVAQLSQEIPFYVENRSKFKRGLDLLAGDGEKLDELPSLPIIEGERNAEKEYKKILFYYLNAVLVKQNSLKTREGQRTADEILLPWWERLEALWQLAEPLIPKEEFASQVSALKDRGEILRALALVHSCSKDWSQLEELSPELTQNGVLSQALKVKEDALVKQLGQQIKKGQFTELAFQLLAYLTTTSWQQAAYLQLDQFAVYRFKKWRSELREINKEILLQDRESLRQARLVALGFILVGKVIEREKLNKAVRKRLEEFYAKLTILLVDTVGQGRLGALCKGSTNKALCADVGLLQGYRLALQNKVWKKILKIKNELLLKRS